MAKYKSEILKVSFKLMTSSIKDEEIEKLDALVNERAKGGWELVTYSFMGEAGSLGRGILVTFKKE